MLAATRLEEAGGVAQSSRPDPRKQPALENGRTSHTAGGYPPRPGGDPLARKTTSSGEKTPEELEAESIENWERAKDHAAMVRREWELAGKPVTVVGHNNIEYEAPLHKILIQVEKEAAARLKEIPKPSKPPGRNLTAVPASISESPASRRRRMKAV